MVEVNSNKILFQFCGAIQKLPTNNYWQVKSKSEWYECKGWNGEEQPLKPLTGSKKILPDVIYLAPINITHYTKGRMLQVTRWQESTCVWIDYLSL